MKRYEKKFPGLNEMKFIKDRSIWILGINKEVER